MMTVLSVYRLTADLLKEPQATAIPPAGLTISVDKIDSGELYRISDELLSGIEDDLTSRQDLDLEDRAPGVKLLGLKISRSAGLRSARRAERLWKA